MTPPKKDDKDQTSFEGQEASEESYLEVHSQNLKGIQRSAFWRVTPASPKGAPVAVAVLLGLAMLCVCVWHPTKTKIDNDKGRLKQEIMYIWSSTLWTFATSFQHLSTNY